MMDYLIRQALVPTEAGYAAVDVQIESGIITAIASQLPGRGTVVDAQNKLLLPAFVNAHTHSPQVWQRGLISPLPLELWLANVFDSATTELKQIYWGAFSTAVSTLLSGGSCVLDHLYLIAGQELETVAAAIQGYKAAGVRAVVAPMLQDQAFFKGLPGGATLSDKSYPQSTAEVLAVMEAIIEQFHEPEAGIYIAVGPAGFQRCSDELFVGCVELSDRHNLCRHTHLLETKSQKILSQEKYGGSAVAHLQKLGFLNHRTTLAHCVWLDDADIEILAETRSTVVHNPVSNLRLGSGIAPILKYIRAGVNVAFGCDGAASNDGQDLLEAIKLGTILHNVTDLEYRHWLTPRQTVQMAALGGFTGVDLAGQTGTLEVGQQADLTLYDLTNLSLLPRTDPLQLVVLGRPSGVVNAVWVAGKQVVAEGQLVKGDNADVSEEVENLKQALLKSSANYQQPQFNLINQIEAHYRDVMGLPEAT